VKLDARDRALVSSFPPIEPASARLLILGSMPGIASLNAQQYYAHPHNRFWRFMEALFGVPRDASYAQRVDALREKRIAVWDVLKHCERPGSLDSNIVRGTETPNDFAAFVARHPDLRAIALNGRAAEAVFRRRVLPVLGETLEGIVLVALPSTSPANAGLRDEAKLAAWSALPALFR
jgi:hypoxanthine-DNA glycosylase